MKAIGKGLLCAAAATVAWLVTAPMFPRLFKDPRQIVAGFIYVLLVCSFIGGAAGFWQGWQRGSKSRAILDALLGLIFGAVGGYFGNGIGGSIATALFGTKVFLVETGAVQIVARMIVLTFQGAFLGLAIGATLRSTRGAISGFVGGALAGLVAGSTFDLISSLVDPFVAGPNVDPKALPETGVVSRGVSAAILGFGIGLFTALVDKAMRQAWLRLELSRNEGREWPVDSARTMIGKDERAHVPLFADPALPGLAAVIERRGPEYLLIDPGSPIGVGLNGFRISQPTPLNPNDTIHVGALTLRFEMKQGAAQKASEGRAKAQPIVPITGGTPITPTSTTPFTPFQPTVNQSAAAPVGFVLVAQSGPMAGQRFPVSGPIEIGREAAGIRLSWDTQASRRHASATPVAGGVQITDLNSTNGVLVNGQRVPSVVLQPGQSVQIGATIFTLQPG